jgi:hypothetical protein
MRAIAPSCSVCPCSAVLGFHKLGRHRLPLSDLQYTPAGAFSILSFPHLIISSSPQTHQSNQETLDFPLFYPACRFVGRHECRTATQRSSQVSLVSLPPSFSHCVCSCQSAMPWFHELRGCLVRILFSKYSSVLLSRKKTCN